MAITADKNRLSKIVHNETSSEFSIVNGQTTYVGALVNFASGSNRVQNASGSVDQQFAGYVESFKNYSGTPVSSGTGNAEGTIKAVVAWDSAVLVNVKASSRVSGNVGKTMFVNDNDEVQGSGAGAASLTPVGVLSEFYQFSPTSPVDYSQAWVILRKFGAQTGSL